jgi:hypothetical protein
MADAPRSAGFSLEDAVLDIGGDIGALILYTDAAYNGREIEVSPIDELDQGQGDAPRHEHGPASAHERGHRHEGDPGHPHDNQRGHRTHTAIHERRSGGQVTYAGIYVELKAGTYRIWTDDPSLPDRVTIIGGQVAEVDWRTER